MMNDLNVKEYIDIECIGKVLRKWNVRYAVLYGSIAEGRETSISDVDLGIKIGRRIRLSEYGLLYTELENCCKKRLDVVILERENPVLLWEALSRGRLLYHCGPPCLEEYYEDLAYAIDLVADMEPLLEMIEEESERALSGTGG